MTGISTTPEPDTPKPGTPDTPGIEPVTPTIPEPDSPKPGTTTTTEPDNQSLGHQIQPKKVEAKENNKIKKNKGRKYKLGKLRQ